MKKSDAIAEARYWRNEALRLRKEADQLRAERDTARGFGRYWNRVANDAIGRASVYLFHLRHVPGWTPDGPAPELEREIVSRVVH